MDEVEPALVPGIIFCDHVIREAGTGKLTLIGCFQALLFKEFPAKKGRFVVVVGVANLRPPLKELNVTCRIENTKSGHVVASFGGKIGFQVEGQPPAALLSNFVLELPLPVPGCTFPEAGTHTAVVLVDNEEIGRRNFPVVPVTAAAAE